MGVSGSNASIDMACKYRSFRRKILTIKKSSPPKVSESTVTDLSKTRGRSIQPVHPPFSESNTIKETGKKTQSAQRAAKIPLDRFLQVKQTTKPLKSTEDRPVVVNDIFGPNLSSPTAIDPEHIPDRSIVIENNSSGRRELSAGQQGISTLMSTLLHHRKEIQIEPKRTKGHRNQKVDRSKRRGEQAARIAQSLKKTGRVERGITFGRDCGIKQNIGESSRGIEVSIEKEADVFGPDINTVSQHEPDDRIAQQDNITLLSQAPPTTLHACATANHLREAYPLDGTPITSSPLSALSSAIPLLLPAPAAQMRSQPRLARKRRILQADESQVTVGLSTTQHRKHTPLARMNSLSINGEWCKSPEREIKGCVVDAFSLYHSSLSRIQVCDLPTDTYTAAKLDVGSQQRPNRNKSNQE